VVEVAGDHTYVQGGMKERKGEERSNKGTDRYPFTISQSLFSNKYSKQT
jgi:hypothetical protein